MTPALHVRRLARRARRDDGSVSLLLVGAALMGFLVIGLVVDGGGAMSAQSRADYAAQEAARAGGQQIDPAQAIPGQAIIVDPGAARAAGTRLPGRRRARGQRHGQRGRTDPHRHCPRHL
ncbi:hypothetical protein SANTM175S_09011 [Streptomyces antimycoticus]